MSRTICYDAKDMEAALREATKYGVDPERYVAEKMITNTWTGITKEGEPVEHGQVKIFWEEVVKQDALDIIRVFAKDNIKPLPYHKPYVRNTGNFCMMSIPDLHYGALSWNGETGFDYDCKIAAKIYSAAINHMLNMISAYPVDTVILPIGSDMLHMDNANNTTNAGTPQDVDGRYSKVLKDCTELVISTITKISEKYKVIVPYVVGNHDMIASYALAMGIELYFRHDKRVEVTNDMTPRKYLRRGNVLCMIDHGDNVKVEKLPEIMASERPVDWGDTEHRYVFRGHFHTKRQYYTMTNEANGGVEVTYCPSLKMPDSWHSKKGYVTAPYQACCQLFNEKHGKFAEFTYTHPKGA